MRVRLFVVLKRGLTFRGYVAEITFAVDGLLMAV